MTSKGFSLPILHMLLIIKAIAAYPCSPCGGSLAAGQYAIEDVSSASGGALIVATGSPVYPTGISILSENTFEGLLAVEGRLPFMGTVSFDSAVPSAGAGAVSYGCGNGNVGMVSEEISPVGYAGRAIGGRGLGCGALY